MLSRGNCLTCHCDADPVLDDLGTRRNVTQGELVTQRNRLRQLHRRGLRPRQEPSLNPPRRQIPCRDSHTVTMMMRQETCCIRSGHILLPAVQRSYLYRSDSHIPASTVHRHSTFHNHVSPQPCTHACPRSERHHPQFRGQRGGRQAAASPTGPDENRVAAAAPWVDPAGSGCRFAPPSPPCCRIHPGRRCPRRWRPARNRPAPNERSHLDWARRAGDLAVGGGETTRVELTR